MPNWDEIRKEWETSEITFKDLAKKHDVKDSTIRSRKNREKWQRNATDENATQRKRVATKKSDGAKSKRKKATSNGERKRSGNPNPKNQFAERNQAALKHGLFSRYIPQETLEIMGMLNEKSPADLIWDQIQIQYAAIIRAQQIMFVADKEETVKELKKLKVENVIGPDGKEMQIPIEKEYELQFAWDRHATFMNAQSRAMSELRSSIKQFNDLAFEDDERKLKLELMQVNINKANAEIEKISTKEDAGPIEIMIKRKGDGP